jgi:hypothetical protein
MNAFVVLVAAQLGTPHLSEHLASHPMPDGWLLKATNQDGQVFTVFKYPTEDACEKAIPDVEKQQHVMYGHCEKNLHPKNPNPK